MRSAHFLGPRVFRAAGDENFWQRLLNRKHLQQAHEFFERYGGKAVVLGRFVPIVRTFVPFVAGAGSMSYPQFAFYNVIGGLLWVGLCVGGGYFFGKPTDCQRQFRAGGRRHRVRLAATDRVEHAHQPIESFLDRRGEVTRLATRYPSTAWALRSSRSQ